MVFLIAGEHQMELLDCVAAKFHEEPGVFKLMVYTQLLCDPYLYTVCVRVGQSATAESSLVGWGGKQ